MISSLFSSRRRGPVSLGRRRQRRGEHLSVQPLEERIALAIDVFQLPMNAVDSAANNYAVLVLDQGQLLEQGHPLDLARHGGAYARLLEAELVTSAGGRGR